jgi:HEAT repeat protein
VVLKRVDVAKSEEAWFTQLKRDKNIAGRMEAARAVAAMGSVTAMEMLRETLLHDTFWAVQAEAARGLGTFKNEVAANYLIHCLDVIDHPKVRRAIYGALKNCKLQRIAIEIEKRFRKEPSYFAEAEGLSALGHIGHVNAEEILKQGLTRSSWNDVIRSAALEGITALKSKQTIPLLLSYTELGHHHRLRMAAVRCLISLGTGSEEIQNRLLALTRDPFLLVQIAAVRGLHQIGDERAIPILKKLTTGDLDGRLMRLSEEAIEKITKGFD